MSFREWIDSIKEEGAMLLTEANGENKTMFQKYPFFSIGLFLTIVAIVFKLLGWKSVSTLFFASVSLVIIAKFFWWVFRFIGHPLTRSCIISLFIFIVSIVMEEVLLMADIPSYAVGIVRVVNIIGKVAICLMAFEFLIRIFILIFVKRS